MIITWPGTATLTASIPDDPGWVSFAYEWTQISGPDTAIIASPNSLVTSVTFPEVQGYYAFQFTAFADSFPADYESYLLTETNEQILTEDGLPLIIDEAETEILGSAITRVFLFTGALVSDYGPTAIGGDLHILINGVEYVTGALDPTKYVRAETLSIQESQDANPNRASFNVRGFLPEIGDEVIILLDDERIFAGNFFSDSHDAEEKLSIDYDQITVVDYNWHLKRRKISRKYENVSGTTIVNEIIGMAPGFTNSRVQAGLAMISIDFSNGVDLATALDQVAALLPGTSWKVNYYKDLFFGVFDASVTPPNPITTSHPTVRNFGVDRNLGSWVTRVRVNGPTTNTTKDRNSVGFLYVDEIKGFEGGGDVNVDGVDTTYTAANRRLVTPDTETNEDDIAPPDIECGSFEDMRKQKLLKISARPIRTGLGINTGLTSQSYKYYTTYVTSKGESKWQEEITVSLPNIPVIYGGFTSSIGGAVASDWQTHPKYNAVEFVAEAIPMSISRINIYRYKSGPIVAGKNGYFIGSLSAKGKFGRIGNNWSSTYSASSTPWDIGSVITPSSNSLVDEKNDAEIEKDLEKIPEEEKGADPICDEEEQDYEEWLEGVPHYGKIDARSRTQRFTIVNDTEAQAILGAKFGDDGVIEDVYTDTELDSLDKMIRAGQDYMAQRNQLDVGIHYESRDRNTHPGRYVTVDLPAPTNCSGEFLIQTVTISGFGYVTEGGPMKSWPLYSVSKAAPRRFSAINRLANR